MTAELAGKRAALKGTHASFLKSAGCLLQKGVRLFERHVAAPIVRDQRIKFAVQRCMGIAARGLFFSGAFRQFFLEVLFFFGLRAFFGEAEFIEAVQKVKTTKNTKKREQWQQLMGVR